MAGLVPAIHALERGTALKTWMPGTGWGMTPRNLIITSQRNPNMNAETPLAFHRRRIETMSNMLGAWMQCEHSACRRTGGCRRAGDVFPACLLPIVHEMNASIAACAAELPGRPPRAQTEEEPVSAQIHRLAKRLAGVLEAQVEEFERKRERSGPRG